MDHHAGYFRLCLKLAWHVLVRSGVLTVHSFAADPTRGLVIMAILGIIIGSGLLMFAVLVGFNR